MRPPTRWYLVIPVPPPPPHRSQTPTSKVVNVPAAGPGTWDYADVQGPVLGTAGPVEHFRVAVEQGIPVPVGEFAAKVQAVLGDPRGWTAGGLDSPAPVMEQQTLGLHGCVANPWPYLNGHRYAGPPGQY
jgi:hypothetical protein